MSKSLREDIAYLDRQIHMLKCMLYHGGTPTPGGDFNPELYYTKLNLSTSGESVIDYANIINAPTSTNVELGLGLSKDADGKVMLGAYLPEIGDQISVVSTDGKGLYFANQDVTTGQGEVQAITPGAIQQLSVAGAKSGHVEVKPGEISMKSLDIIANTETNIIANLNQVVLGIKGEQGLSNIYMIQQGFFMRSSPGTSASGSYPYSNMDLVNTKSALSTHSSTTTRSTIETEIGAAKMETKGVSSTTTLTVNEQAVHITSSDDTCLVLDKLAEYSSSVFPANASETTLVPLSELDKLKNKVVIANTTQSTVSGREVTYILDAEANLVFDVSNVTDGDFIHIIGAIGSSSSVSRSDNGIAIKPLSNPTLVANMDLNGGRTTSFVFSTVDGVFYQFS